MAKAYMGFHHDDGDLVEVWKDDIPDNPSPEQIVPAILLLIQELITTMYPDKAQLYFNRKEPGVQALPPTES